MDDKFKATFREESQELLSEIEEGLLTLEENPDDEEAIGQVFRGMHTIKGSGAMFEFMAVSEFAHKVETVLSLIRDGELRADRKLISLFLAARDQLEVIINLDEPFPENVVEQSEEIAAELEAAMAPPGEEAEDKQADQAEEALPEQPDQAQPEQEVEEKGEQTTYTIRLAPGPKAFEDGLDPAATIEELSSLGEVKLAADTTGVPPLEELDPSRCYMAWEIELTTSAPKEKIDDIFLFLDADSKVTITEAGQEPPEESSEPKQAEAAKPAAASTLRKDSDRRSGGERRQGDRRGPTAAPPSSVRVPADKLDYLVDMVGELVIAQARLSQMSVRKNDTDFISIAEEMERLTAELRDSTLNIRMIPIGTTFGKFRRLVRDLGAELGKSAELETEGADTELDKTVIEQLGDPLVHLIRNSVDHGIELPEVREAAGKPKRGLVKLTASHSGGNVLIRIKDDGAGMDPKKIFEKSVEKGLVAADAVLSEKEIFQLIFAAGMSTAEQVSNVSGRGVGMDVVKRAIEQLRGSISIESKEGKGSTITIKLPLTLAIIEGLLVKVGDESFVMPLQMVENCIELSREDVEAAHGHKLANVRGELVPYINLREWFTVAGQTPDIEQLVITSSEGERFGFVVDKVIGQHQTVIKSLGEMYQDVEGLSGATILGDGSVALIMDVPKLISGATTQEQAV